MTKKATCQKEKTEADIRAEINEQFQRWNALAQGGCQDLTWPDGVNMNLVRNHIIYGYNELKMRGLVQMSLFGDIIGERPVPPKVPDSYMVLDGPYSNRLNGKRENLVWRRSLQKGSDESEQAKKPISKRFVDLVSDGG